MMKYLKRLYEDWTRLRLIRQNLDVLDPIKNEDIVKYIVNRYNEDNEQNISDIMCHYLTKEMIKGNITNEMHSGYLMALEHRTMLFRNHRKLLNKKPQ